MLEKAWGGVKAFLILLFLLSFSKDVVEVEIDTVNLWRKLPTLADTYSFAPLLKVKLRLACCGKLLKYERLLSTSSLLTKVSPGNPRSFPQVMQIVLLSQRDGLSEP